MRSFSGTSGGRDRTTRDSVTCRLSSIAILLLLSCIAAAGAASLPALLELDSPNAAGSYGPGSLIVISALYDEGLAPGSSVDILLNNNVPLTLNTLATQPAPHHKGSIVNGGGGGAGALLNCPVSVYVLGNYAYVASCDSNALEIVDISSPAHPAHAGSIVDGGGIDPQLNAPYSVFVVGNYAYVASIGSDALEIVDVTNKVLPAHAGSILNDAGGGDPRLNKPMSVFVSGNYAYAASADSDALEIVDVTNKVLPAHAGSILNGVGGADPQLNGPVAVFVSGDYAYVASAESNALEIVDVSDPTAPAHAGSILNGVGGADPQLSKPTSVFVSGNYAYVTSADSDALEIVDVSDPTAPAHAGSIVDGAGGALLNYPLSVFVSGNYAYVASAESNAIEVVDVANKALPAHAGSIVHGDGGALLDYPQSVFVSGDYAYVASSDSDALEVVSVNTSTLSGNYVVGPRQSIPLLDVAAITAQNAVGLGGGTNISATLPATNLADNVALTIVDPVPEAQSESSDSSSPPVLVHPPGTVTVNVGGNSAVGRVTVTGTGVSDLIVTGRTVTGPGDPLPPGTVYQYIDLVPARFTTITEATITFTVPASWLEEHHLSPEDIMLYHFTGTAWVALPTTVVSIVNGVVTFTAKTSSFSIFAIIGLPHAQSTVTTPATAVTTVAPATVTPAREPVAQEPTIQQTTAAPGPVAEQPPVFPVAVIGIIGLGLIGGGVIFRRWWIRRQNPALFSEDD